jgi:hypothetical protein
VEASYRSCFGGGVGRGLTISLVLLSEYFYPQRPKGWDTSASRAKNATAEACHEWMKSCQVHRLRRIYSLQQMVRPEPERTLAMYKLPLPLHYFDHFGADCLRPVGPFHLIALNGMNRFEFYPMRVANARAKNRDG